MMTFKQVQKKVDKKAYKEKTGKAYKEDFYDNLPVYILLDENFEEQIMEKKVYNPALRKIQVKKEKGIYTGSQIRGLKKMGQQINILTEQDIKDIKDHNKNQQRAIEQARKEGYEKAKKELEKKNNSK